MADRSGNNDPPRRPPRNLQGLLKFCSEVTAQEDTTQDSSVAEISQERREFLENVLSGMQGNVAKLMADCLHKLIEPCVDNIGDDVSEQEAALEQLSDCVEDMNYAIDLFKMNGFPVLIQLLDSPHSSLQKGAAQVIGDICQNNELCQQNMLPLNPMEKLLKIIDNHESPDCKVKALYALSCLTRNFEMGEKLFVKLSGFCFLMRAMQSKIPKLIIKSIFLLLYFTEKNDEQKETLLNMGFIEQLVTLLLSDAIDNTSREYCTLSLLNLCSRCESALRECLRPEFDLVSHLNERKISISSNEEFEDEENHITSLLKLLEQNNEEEESVIR